MSFITFRESWPFQILEEHLTPLKGHLAELESHIHNVSHWILKIPSEKLELAYEKDKWTIRQLILHLVDSHQQLMFRLVSIARQDDVHLSGSDENLWVKNSFSDSLTPSQLLDGYNKVSSYSLWIWKTIPENRLDAKGVVNNIEITPKELLKYLIAHEKHHMEVVNQRYLKI